MAWDVGSVAIVGTGLLGGSLGLALREAGFPGRILGVGRRPETLQTALDRGCIDEACTSIQDAARRCELIVLATPLGMFEPLLQELSSGSCDHAIVTDVGSTKQYVCSLAGRIIPGVRFVGSHPMAGSEQHGPQFARADLYRGAPCIITPVETSDPAAVSTVEGLWSALGMRVLRMSPQQHDAFAAQVSHLPHALAALLVHQAVSRGGLEMASTGFRDATRIASSDPAVWIDIFATNREAVLQSLDAFANAIADLRAKLADPAGQGLQQWLAQSKQARDAWYRHRFGAAASPRAQG